MNLSYLLYAAFGLWVLQQVNDIVNSFINRQYVPKMFWVSAAASLLSGGFMFAFLYLFLDAVGNDFAIVNDFIMSVVKVLGN